MGEVIVAIGYSDTEILMEQDGIFDAIEENKLEEQRKNFHWEEQTKVNQYTLKRSPPVFIHTCTACSPPSPA